MNKKIEKTQKFKIKTEYILIILLIVIAVFMFLYGGSSKGFLGKKTSSYESGLEDKIVSTLSEIKGVGTVKVFINFYGGEQENVLKETSITVANGETLTKESVVMVNGKPYSLGKLNPEISAIIVVCDGGDDVNVKLTITETLTTIFNISSNKIKILKRK